MGCKGLRDVRMGQSSKGLGIANHIPIRVRYNPDTIVVRLSGLCVNLNLV